MTIPLNSSFTYHHQASDASHARADHGHVAISPSGHMAVAYSHESGAKKVAVRIYDYDSATDTYTPQAVVDVGIPGTSVYPGGESCQKPWVSALADDSFVVSWHRKDTSAAVSSTSPNARTEVVRVAKSGSTWAVDAPASGIGYALDSSVAAGDADVVLRTACLQGRILATAHVSQVGYSSSGGTTTRSHSLRLGYLEFPTGTGAPTVLYTGAVDSAVPVDDTSADPWAASSGGLVLPSVAPTAEGDVIVAWERYDGSAASGQRGSIEVRILAGPYHSSPATQRASLTLYSSSDNPFRRPWLASGVQSPNLALVVPRQVGWLAYGEQNTTSPGGSKAFVAELRRLGSGSLYADTDQVSALSGWDGLADQLSQPCVAPSGDAAMTLALDGEGSSILVRSSQDLLTFASPSVYHISRPAFAVRQISGRSTERYAMSYEGSRDGAASSSQVHIVAFGGDK